MLPHTKKYKTKAHKATQTKQEHNQVCYQNISASFQPILEFLIGEQKLIELSMSSSNIKTKLQVEGIQGERSGWLNSRLLFSYYRVKNAWIGSAGVRSITTNIAATKYVTMEDKDPEGPCNNNKAIKQLKADIW